jgi:hypothetical protein
VQNSATMKVKEELIREIEKMSEDEVVKVMDFVRKLQSDAREVKTNPV